MNFGVTLGRSPGKKIPDDLAALIHEKNKTGWGWAATRTDGAFIVMRKHRGPSTFDELKDALNNDKLSQRQVFFSFTNNAKMLTDDDVQPYPVLSDAEGHPLIVAFMNGNFDRYAQEGSVELPETLCAKTISKIVQKAYKYAGEDLPKTILELKDELNAEVFANMMTGPNGSITLLSASGDVHTFLVASDNASGEVGEVWLSDTLADRVPAAPEVVEADDEFGDKTAKPAAAPVPPTPTPSKGMPPVPGAAPAASKPAPVAKGTAKPVADTKPIGGTGKADGGKPVDLSDPNAVLTLKIPDNMLNKSIGKRLKWLQHRMPDAWAAPKQISGLLSISCKRSECVPKFLQEYAEQNRLGMDALKAMPKAGTATVVPKAAGEPAKELPKSTPSGVPSLPPIPGEPAKEQGHPERTPETQAKLDGVDKKTDVKGGLSLQPIFTQDQKDELLHFMAQDDVAAAVDAHGKIINAPAGLEQMMKKVANFTDQFGGKITINNIATLPLESLKKYAKHDPDSAAKAMFFLSIELLQAFAMLDTLTGNTNNKKAEETVKTEAAKHTASHGGGARKGMAAIP